MTLDQELLLLNLRQRYLVSCRRRGTAGGFTSNRGGLRQAPLAAVGNPAGYRTAMADFGS